ncbi:MAG TPA: MFS transporter [Allosphingosinicella sp.]|nr:MFS transporter [Allosphingosinicella sp.]
MRGAAITLSPARGGVRRGDGAPPGWAWPVAVLALCHGQAIASFQILNILVDPIRASLHISDTQYSLLQGLAVAIFSAALGIPAARWADRHGRRGVILAGAIGWSLATVACAFVASFAQLFAARVAMGIGEVFLFPAAFALIADLVPRARLSTAIACFGAGGPIGGAAAMFGGGWIVAHVTGPVEGWRIAFFACGLTGLVSAALLLTVGERRPADDAPHLGFAGVLAYLGARGRLYGPVAAAMIFLSICAFASAAWVPTAFSRVYGMGSDGAGALTAAGSLAGGTGLVWAAGRLVDLLAARGDRAGPASVGIGLCLLLAALAGAAVLFLSGRAAVALWLCAYSLLGIPTVLGGTAFQMITAPRLRAQVMAVYLLLMNLLALSLGPFLVAWLTDHLFHRPDRVAQSLAIVVAGAALAGAFCFLAVRRRFAAAAAEAAGIGGVDAIALPDTA